jgi:serine/threonine-protein kinase/endoribonuclease IRE1
VDDDEEIEKAESTTDADDRNVGMAAEEQAQVHYNTKRAPVSEASDNESTRKTALSALNSGLIDAEINEITGIAKSVDLGTVAKQPHYRDESASLNAEEGGQVMKGTEGQKIAARGEDRSLVISEDVLGYGSSGTVVFKGTFQGRAVAVKRLLRDFVDVAAKEVSLLESADSHANVIRYYYKETTGNFLFIALELCPASLSEIIERPNDFVELSAALKPKKALAQIASGLQHLHALSIVHRDIKPQNILVSTGANGQLKMLLSDFGLSKRLDGAAQASFSQTVNNPGGTFGWRAPEILNGEVVLDSTSASNRDHSTGSNLAPSGSTNDEKKRLTRAVDIFALGCVFYYVLSNGDHPFGSRYERELNIMRGVKDLSRLDGLGEEGHEAQHLIAIMISQESSERLSATQTLSHPYFWDAGRRLAFLQDTSDRFDIMDRDPPEAPLVALENNAHLVIGSDWHRKLDKAIMEDLNKRRSYDQKSVAALLRAIRNKKHHIHDVSPQVRRIFTAAGGARNTAGATNAPVVENLASNVPLLPDAFLAYFTARFPRLFLHAYEVVNGFEVLKQEVSFAQYFRPQAGND